MNVLAMDTSAVTASCAIRNEKGIIAQSELRNGLTHSQTILPMITDMLKNAHISLDEIDLLAVNVGPGSFTGVRIGVAAVKGLAFTRNIPCAAVSTLESMVYPLRGLPIAGIVCAVMDARRGQVYNALFSVEGGSVERLAPDRAISIEDLKKELENVKKSVFLVGDGADLCYNLLQPIAIPLTVAPDPLKYQHAVGTAAVALRLYEHGETCPAEKLTPVYLRLPQAERELKAKQNAE